MISVLMAVGPDERPDYLASALGSLERQTEPADEVVLVEDGPMGAALADVAAGFADRLPLRRVPLPVNAGLGAALRIGLETCRGDLVARLDSDDVAMPQRLEKQGAAFRSDPRLDILGSWAVEIDAAGRPGATRRVPVDHEAIVGTLWANPIIHPAVTFRRESVLAAGSYRADLRRRQDYELWFRCAAAGLRFANLAEPLIRYRFTPETLRQGPSAAFAAARIGASGARAAGFPLWVQMACFVPFARSLLPPPLQMPAYRMLRKLDPRR